MIITKNLSVRDVVFRKERDCYSIQFMLDLHQTTKKDTTKKTIFLISILHDILLRLKQKKRNKNTNSGFCGNHLYEKMRNVPDNEWNLFIENLKTSVPSFECLKKNLAVVEEVTDCVECDILNGMKKNELFTD